MLMEIRYLIAVTSRFNNSTFYMKTLTSLSCFLAKLFIGIISCLHSFSKLLLKSNFATETSVYFGIVRTSQL